MLCNNARFPGYFRLRRMATARQAGGTALVGWGCRCRNVRLLGEATLAPGFADESHCAVEIGVETVGASASALFLCPHFQRMGFAGFA
jgi:hypothetical protein